MSGTMLPVAGLSARQAGWDEDSQLRTGEGPSKKKAGAHRGPGFFVFCQCALFADESVNVGFMHHAHQASVLGLDDLEVMVG